MSSLHAQLFLTALRLYIHEAWYLQRPIDLEDDQRDLSSLPAFRDDPTRQYVLQVTMFAAHVSNFAHGNKPRTWDGWRKLKRLSEELQRDTPTFFHPIFAQLPIEGDPFPKSIFANDLYAHTQQWFNVTCMLLINSLPRTPPPPELDSRFSNPAEINVSYPFPPRNTRQNIPPDSQISVRNSHLDPQDAWHRLFALRLDLVHRHLRPRRLVRRASVGRSVGARTRVDFAATHPMPRSRLGCISRSCTHATATSLGLGAGRGPLCECHMRGFHTPITVKHARNESRSGASGDRRSAFDSIGNVGG